MLPRPFAAVCLCGKLRREFDLLVTEADESIPVMI